jgi:hypothetical protein
LAQAVINEDASGDIAALQREIQQLKVSKWKLPMFFFNRKWFDSFGFICISFSIHICSIHKL